MKKALVTIAIISVSLFSCKKKDDPKPRQDIAYSNGQDILYFSDPYQTDPLGVKYNDKNFTLRFNKTYNMFMSDTINNYHIQLSELPDTHYSQALYFQSFNDFNNIYNRRGIIRRMQ